MRLIYEEIKNRMKENLENNASKIEGSFAMDNISAVATELARMKEMEIDTIIDDVFLDSATSLNLDKKAKEYGEVRNEAKKAVGEITIVGTTGTAIYKGTELISTGNVIYEVIEDVIIPAGGTAIAKIKCITSGAVGNSEERTIIGFKSSLQGISEVFNESKIVGGTDREDDESFRNRILEKIRKPITSGNKNHYIYWAKQVSGVKDAKVIPLANGNGTVRVILLSTAYNSPDTEVLKAVRQHIENVRPVGADVEVVPAEPKNIRLEIDIKLEPGGDLNLVKNEIKKNLNEYIKTIIFDEEKPLSYYKVGDIVFNAEGIQDILDYKLNGAKESITASFNEYFYLSEVVVNGS